MEIATRKRQCARRGFARWCVARGMALLAGSLFVACGSSSDSQSSSRYLVTREPIDVGVNPAGLCVAVDPTDPRGVWWWQPGPLDCSSRSTGPAVFHAEEAAVAPLPDGAVDIYFRIALIPLPERSGPPFADIALRLEGGQMRADATGAQVSMGVRTDLDIPEAR